MSQSTRIKGGIPSSSHVSGEFAHRYHLIRISADDSIPDVRFAIFGEIVLDGREVKCVAGLVEVEQQFLACFLRECGGHSQVWASVLARWECGPEIEV